MDSKFDRLATIAQTLKVKKASTIRELATTLEVSEMTVRRDLAILAERNVVKLMHGGAVYNQDNPEKAEGEPSRYHLDREEDLFAEQKRRIAEKAAALIAPKDVVIIDSGSTTESMSAFIPGDVTIICYALNILYEVYDKKDCRLIFGGGYYHENTMMFESAQAVDLIRKNRANKAFLSARGLSEKLGITTADHYEIEVKRAALESSQERILLVDSSKMGKVRSAYYADLSDFDTIVTDSGISEEYAAMIRSHGITLHIV